MKKYYSTPRIRTIDLSSEPVMLVVSVNPNPQEGTGENYNSREQGQNPPSIWDNWTE